ncbi:MAG: hypothetical protein QNL62_09435 [Gammaproteobacteria bacterium]|nr:hypothetical protein [Gammaproteobacteria bacterium]
MPIKKLKQQLDEQYRAWLIVFLILLAAIILSIRFVLSTGEGIPASDKVFTITAQQYQ